MRIFVGNLSGETTEDDLRRAFERFGEVKSATIVTDATVGKSRRFGFVIMPSASQTSGAIKGMDGKELKGQKIKVERSRTSTKARSSRRKRSRASKAPSPTRGRKKRAGGPRRKHRR